MCAELGELSLRCRLDMGKGQSEFLRVAPANRRSFDGNRVNIILRKDPTDELRSDWDEDRTPDTTASGGKVSELALTGHLLTLRVKFATAVDGHTHMLTHDDRAMARRQGPIIS